VPDPGTTPGGDSLEVSSYLVVPLVARDRAVGALSLVRAEERYADDDLDLMAELGRRAALAIDNALLYEQARSADRAKANFLAVMSHEFRTPLSAILGYADILTARVHGELTAKQANHVERVKASVRHLSHLVDEILSYASMEAGRERVRPERLELVALAADVAGIMEPIAEAAGLELRSALPPNPVELVTDGSKVRQILINLLSNAIKYTQSGHVELVVEVRGGGVICRVSDSGPGIPAEHLEDVFEPFWQVERSDRRRVTGTGLGLAVARRLARLLGGEVRVASEVGEGSTFTLELPG
jgi:signal transduction histidine kinase